MRKEVDDDAVGRDGGDCAVPAEESQVGTDAADAGVDAGAVGTALDCE